MAVLLFNGGCLGWRTLLTEEVIMPAIVEFPQVVRQALPDFADLFSCEPQRQHVAEYVTGLLVARKENVSAINREFANTTSIAGKKSKRKHWLRPSRPKIAKNFAVETGGNGTSPARSEFPK